jgi:ATP/maltotriose-dependent transcriptional regulator MalT
LGYGSSSHDDETSGLIARWPLRGRREQVRSVLDALSAGQGVVLVGEPGVGKTRLAQEVAEAAAEHGHPVRWALATPAVRSIAFGAMARVVPAAGPASANRLTILQRSLDSLRALSGERPLVLAVDDAHLLDDCSAALVHLAAVAAGVLVVMTARTTADLPDLVTALWKEGLAARIELQPLTREDMLALTADVLEGELDQRTAQLLWRVTLGNPLYLRELLLSGLGGGRLRQTGGLWHWDGPLEVGPRLSEVVRGRLGDLGPGVRRTLEILAVAQPLELALLEGLSEEEALAEGERKGLIVIVRDGRRCSARLAHPLYAEVIRERVPAYRVARIMEQLAVALEATGARRGTDLVRSCDWRLQAGLQVPDSALLASATLAGEARDWELADRLLASVKRKGASGQVRHALGGALVSTARWWDAEAVFAGIDPADLPEKALGPLVTARIYNLATVLGRPSEAEEIVERMALALPDRPSWLPYARAQIATARGDIDAALAALKDMRDDPASARWPSIALLLVATAIGLSGDIARAVGMFERALGELVLETDAPMRRWLRAPRSQLGLLGGYYEQTQIEQAHAEAIVGGDRARIWLTAALMGVVVLARGDVPGARRWAAELGALSAGAPSCTMRDGSLAMRARLLALAGETEEAAAALAEVDDVACSEPWTASTIAGARCAVAAARGNPEQAREIALEAADRAIALGLHAMAVCHACDAARSGAPVEAAGRVRRIAGRLTGPLLPVIAGHVLAWATGDGDGVGAASQAYSAIGAHLLAAEAAVTAAQLHREAGNGARDAGLEARAARLVERCAGCRSPVLDGARQPSSLTARERQIVRLASDGFSNREIGHRLGISTRTVETHLQHAYDKLGVTARSELSGALGGPPN